MSSEPERLRFPELAIEALGTVLRISKFIILLRLFSVMLGVRRRGIN